MADRLTSGEDAEMLMPVGQIVGDDEEDIRLLNDMAGEAARYITSFRWCPPIRAQYLACGVGKIVAVFLFEFTGKIGGTDDRLWVVVGDLPSAYMVVEPGDGGRAVLENYCRLMDVWVEAVRSSGDFNDVYPVDAARTPVNAEQLHGRLGFIRLTILPYLSEGGID
jgi:hypothetical protein